MRLALVNLFLSGLLAGSVATYAWRGSELRRQSLAGIARLEVEVAAARGGGVYLVLDPAGQRLALACRGVPLWSCDVRCDPALRCEPGTALQLRSRDASGSPPAAATDPLRTAQLLAPAPAPQVQAAATAGRRLDFGAVRLHLRPQTTPRHAAMPAAVAPARPAAGALDVEVALHSDDAATLWGALPEGAALLVQAIPAAAPPTDRSPAPGR
jgi:hypothetical protein